MFLRSNVGRASDALRPRPHPQLRAQIIDLSGAPERIRTSDPQIRSLVLYPAELRALVCVCGHAGALGNRRAKAAPKLATTNGSDPVAQGPCHPYARSSVRAAGVGSSWL